MAMLIACAMHGFTKILHALSANFSIRQLQKLATIEFTDSKINIHYISLLAACGSVMCSLLLQ